MYKVIAEAASGYLGCSRKLAFQYARACIATNRNFLIMKRYGAHWRLLAEYKE